jgi:CO/xanthine dehydrogenase Mo-binding subunit
MHDISQSFDPGTIVNPAVANAVSRRNGKRARAMPMAQQV